MHVAHRLVSGLHPDAGQQQTAPVTPPPDLAVVRQDDVDHGLPSVMFLIVTRMSLSSSPVCGCAGLPQPRSSKMPAAETRAAGGTASWLTMPASTLMQSSVCPRASDRKSAGIVFRGNGLRGEPTPLLLAQASRVRRGDNHANNIAQKARGRWAVSIRSMCRRGTRH